MEKRQAIFTQETGEDAVVVLSDSFTLEDAKERYPEWRFRFCELQLQYLPVGGDGFIIDNDTEY
tara:strand:+ start:1015 stop:1206 length:192 start_codon:yes stop_codon:yes gene_type:complete